MKTIKDFTAADISLSDCTAYHADRANTTWAAATTEEKEAALVRGFDYIRVQPFRTDTDLFTDGIPQDVERAAWEAALIEITTPGILLKDQARDDHISEMKLNTMAIKYQADARDQFKKIEALLGPYMARGIILTK